MIQPNPTPNRPLRPAPFLRFVAAARPWKPGLWRLALTLGLVLSAALISAEGLLGSIENPGAQGFWTAEAQAGLLIAIATMMPALWLGIRLVHDRRPRSLISPTGALSWTLIWRGCLLAVFVVSMMLGVSVASGDSVLEWRGVADISPLMWGGVILMIPIQSAAEELLFRGYLMQELRRRSHLAIVWLLAPALLFAGWHYTGAPLSGEHAVYLTQMLIFGLFAGALLWRYGDLSICIGFHTVNNLIAIGLFRGDGDFGIGPITLDRAAASASGVGDLMVTAFVFAAAYWLAHRWAR